RVFTAAAIASATFALTGISSAQQPQTTLTGCVYEEADVPGRAPNPAERIGILEDYILAEVSPAEAAKSAAGTPTTYSMYKLEHTADDQLEALVGKRVEATGQISADIDDASGQPPASARTNDTDKVIGHDRIDLPEFEVASIKAVDGSCPATPTMDR
ncbi:MAG: hypothetical protein AB7P22_19470, partial [Vicinamibacterales bacterium]